MFEIGDINSKWLFCGLVDFSDFGNIEVWWYPSQVTVLLKKDAI